MLRALFTSDWHLGALHSHFGEQALEMQLKEVEKIYQAAIAQGINHLFVLGDLSDTPTLSEQAMIGLLRILLAYDKHITTYYLAGNHDFAQKGKTALDLLAMLRKEDFLNNFHLYLSPEQSRIEKVHINFLSYPATRSLTEKRAVKGSLNLAHVELKGALGDNSLPLKTKTSFLAHPLDGTISGHIHLHQFLRKHNFLYCGSPYQKNFGEKLPKGYLIAEIGYVRNKIAFRYQFHNLKPHFELRELFIKDLKALQGISRNPHHRYKLYVQDDLLLPADLTLTYPNIHKIIGLHKPNSELLDLMQLAQKEAQVISPLTGLRSFLLQRGFSKKERQKAKILVQNALKTIC